MQQGKEQGCFYELKPDGIYIDVKVIPGASREEVGAVVEGALAVKLTARPVEGQANKALLKVLARHLKVRKSALEIVRGQKSRLKTVRIDEPEAEDALKKLIS